MAQTRTPDELLIEQREQFMEKHAIVATVFSQKICGDESEFDGLYFLMCSDVDQFMSRHEIGTTRKIKIEWPVSGELKFIIKTMRDHVSANGVGFNVDTKIVGFCKSAKQASELDARVYLARAENYSMPWMLYPFISYLTLLKSGVLRFDESYLSSVTRDRDHERAPVKCYRAYKILLRLPVEIWFIVARLIFDFGDQLIKPDRLALNLRYCISNHFSGRK